jgi:hypothetical protein
MLKKEASRQPVMISSLGAELSCDVGTNQKPRFRPGQTAIAEAKLDGFSGRLPNRGDERKRVCLLLLFSDKCQSFSLSSGGNHVSCCFRH